MDADRPTQTIAIAPLLPDRPEGPGVELYLGRTFSLRYEGKELNLPGPAAPLDDLALGQTPVAPAVILATAEEAQTLPLRLVDEDALRLRLILVDADVRHRLSGPLRRILHGAAPPLADEDALLLLQTLARSAADLLLLRETQDALRADLSRLNHIGVALSTVHNSEKLLDMILESGRGISCCDAGSLYLVDKDGDGGSLLFVASHNDSVDFPFSRRRMPLSVDSVAGYVAVTGEEVLLDDVYAIPPGAPYSFNRSFDESTGYRSVNMLVAPMKNQQGEVRGVLQLINRKQRDQIRLRDRDATPSLVRPFDSTILELVRSLASQAAVALDNARLYEDIRRLFSGFVEAVTVAVEARDPSTMGHSIRVAKLALALAREIDDCRQGPLAEAHFTEADYDVIRFSSLLHDFGKFGVPEPVLLKSHKLPGGREEVIRLRARIMHHLITAEYSRQECDILMAHPAPEAEQIRTALAERMERLLRTVDDDLAFIVERNAAYACSDEDAERIQAIGRTGVMLRNGERASLLDDEDVRNLTIPRGTLTAQERVVMEQHVEHSYQFLRRIPWSRDLAAVPEVVYAHHEKLDGTGYPRGLTAAQIPLSARIMVICDLYDALTSSDRPYKKALSIEKTLEIIKDEVNKGFVDPDVFAVFVAARIYDKVHQRADAD